MCLAVASAGARYAMGPSVVPPTIKPPTITVGALLPSLALFNPNKATASIVVALSTSCRFCTESVPFYKRLAAMNEVREGRLQFSVASVQAERQMRAYLTTHDLSLDGREVIVPISESALRVAVTPTVILVDRSGIVVRTWQGRLDPSAEDDVVKLAIQVSQS
jgi:hypothetical protein